MREKLKKNFKNFGDKKSKQREVQESQIQTLTYLTTIGINKSKTYQIWRISNPSSCHFLFFFSARLHNTFQTRKISFSLFLKNLRINVPQNWSNRNRPSQPQGKKFENSLLRDSDLGLTNYQPQKKIFIKNIEFYWIFNFKHRT